MNRPTGRWNRDLGHRVEIMYDSPACWFVCSCGAQGSPHRATEQADAEAEAHEREAFEAGKQSKRFVRGRYE